MRVTMVNTMYAPNAYGGAERVVQLLSEELVRAGHEVTVVCLGAARDVQSYELHGVEVRQVPLANLYWPYGTSSAGRVMESAWHVIDLWNPVMAERARREIASTQPDIIHTHNLVGFSPRVWRRVKRYAPIVHTLHDYRLVCVRASMFKDGEECVDRCASCRLASVIRDRPASDVDTVVGVSEDVLLAHSQAGLFAGAARAVIPVPVEPVKVQRTARSGGPIRFGFLGRLDPIKGIELLLAASTDLPSDGWSLEIAGEGDAEYTEKLLSFPRGARVQFSGHSSREEFFARTDVAIVPTRGRESAGLVAAEALSFGIPVVASRRGGLPEIVTEGETGWLIEPDAEQLRNTIAGIIEHPFVIDEMRAACVARSQRHAIDQIAGCYISTYEDAIARRSRSLG